MKRAWNAYGRWLNGHWLDWCLTIAAVNTFGIFSNDNPWWRAMCVVFALYFSGCVGWELRKRHDAKAAKSAPFDPDASRRNLLDLADVMAPMYEYASGQRARLEQMGYSPTIAEQLSAQMLLNLLQAMNGST